MECLECRSEREATNVVVGSECRPQLLRAAGKAQPSTCHFSPQQSNEQLSKKRHPNHKGWIAFFTPFLLFRERGGLNSSMSLSEKNQCSFVNYVQSQRFETGERMTRKQERMRTCMTIMEATSSRDRAKPPAANPDTHGNAKQNGPDNSPLSRSSPTTRCKSAMENENDPFGTEKPNPGGSTTIALTPCLSSSWRSVS